MNFRMAYPVSWNGTMRLWDATPEEALRIQDDLKSRVALKRGFSKLEVVAGADVAFAGDRVFAAVVAFEYPKLEIIEESYSGAKTAFPYIPGLLSFREGPVLIECYRSLSCDPDLIIFDGQGIAHPKGLGLASHMGVVLGKPAIGCAKSRLIGRYSEPGWTKGSRSDLRAGGRVVGAVVRTKTGVKPVFVSPGHLTDIHTSTEVVLNCSRGYRLPEPTRVAHIRVEEFKKGMILTAR